MIFIVAASYVIEKNKNKRVSEVLEERRKLINLISVTNGRIFEYDVNEDRFMTARASKEGYENVRYIDNFHESAKQYRYVLFADFAILDRFVEDCRNGVADIEYDMRLRDRNADYIWYRIKGSIIAAIPPRLSDILRTSMTARNWSLELRMRIRETLLPSCINMTMFVNLSMII